MRPLKLLWIRKASLLANKQYVLYCFANWFLIHLFTGSSYNNLYKKVSVLVDQNLNEEVSRQLLEEHPIGTKSDLVIDFAEDGALSLLKKWPDMKYKLYYCLNQPMPFKVRQLAWRLYLTNTKGICWSIHIYFSLIMMKFHSLLN